MLGIIGAMDIEIEKINARLENKKRCLLYNGHTRKN